MERAFWSSVKSINLYSRRNIMSVTEDLFKVKKNQMSKERTTINNKRKTLKETKDK